ncbi:HipA domain-containing protein [Kiritimatiella glycovorans]|uniref:Serine/threonine-protein kinase HipA n=1 Tax=Kiritimatiella glycovorans TaxID=1307763 RepID=A0A0G3EGN3_9BACT|nr:HipA domain-containing protein [Kiritimatiella glycovorans]AKJ65636.1 Serine/threonine-protein kinase HipA [Kiritimatiella glycovorans]
MSHCPINLESLPEGCKYSETGLKSIHPKLKHLKPFEYSYEEQLREVRRRSGKMSIQGVQPKLSAVLKLKDASFALVNRGGRFILKPNPLACEEVPANEALTMSMAAAAGIHVPVHGLLCAQDDSWVYFVKRYDREGRSKKVHVEDFAQLSASTRETKYDSSLERVAQLVEQFCTFPAIEKPKLAKRLLFCFLTGNEDMHLKNFSIWVQDGVVSLTPAYDLLNSTLVLENAKEESALPLHGKKKKLTKKLWLDYFCRDRLKLSEVQVDKILQDFQEAMPAFDGLIGRSFLSEERKAGYRDILLERVRRLGISG